MFKRYLPALALLCSLALAPAAMAGDWPYMRGPQQDSASREQNLPEKWSLAGDNLNWRVPIGGRSTPIVVGDRVFVHTHIGSGATLQERVVCLDADSGKVIWEHRINIYSSDVPPHRTAWAPPVYDYDTGNLYAFAVNATVVALDRNGKVVWERFMTEDFGAVTTHGGRTATPIIDGDLVIVSTVSTGWGVQSRPGHRFFAFDKRSGDTVWVSSPGTRLPFDTTYAPPIIADVNGTRLLIAGGGDGAVHAIKPQTGEPVWRFEISKRGINTGVALVGDSVFVSHGEENLDTSEMGLIAAVDANSSGEITLDKARWRVNSELFGYSSPVADGQRVYQIDNSANLHAFDAATGNKLWVKNLGTIQRASLVMGDGKLYVGTENGKFYILRPRADGCDIVSEVQIGTQAQPEIIYASAAISNGRVFLISDTALYSFGRKQAAGNASRTPQAAVSTGPPAHVQVAPTEVVAKPGDNLQFRARLYDAKGVFIRETQATWTLEGLRGEITAGRFTPAAGAAAGEVKAAVGDLTGSARVRVIPSMPVDETFDAYPVNSVPGHWINTRVKYQVREVEGNKLLVKLADNPATKRARTAFGPVEWSNYTIEADIKALPRRRLLGDAGVVAQRYAMILFGNHQRLELMTWQPETARTVQVPFAWKPDTWYRVKLEVQTLADGRVRARGKVWLRDEAEPAAWTIEKVDPPGLGQTQGSPGVYGDAAAEIYFDNVKVIPNR